MNTTDTNATPRKLYTQQRFLFMTLDPVHVGTGGYRLGRVDMTIAREPGTNVPKVPGTSLAGATRSYAAMSYGKPDVAGQQKKFKDAGGNGDSCPIIYTFGTATDIGGEQTGGANRAGTVSIGDAQILFFPVSSMVGSLWVSTVERVREAWGKGSVTTTEPTDETVVTSMDWNRELNLGWLLFQAQSGLKIDPPATVKSHPGWEAIAGRIVLTTPKLFSQIVNSNLEVRTSVSINPETGAAEQGALFTYEAIPRTTWLWSDVVEDDYRFKEDGTSEFPVTRQQCKIETIVEIKNGKEEKRKKYTDNAGALLDTPWGRPLDVVRAGMELIKYLGVGGMGTRGFGRLHLIDDWDVNKGDEQ